MKTKTVELIDSLDDRVKQAWERLIGIFNSWLDERPDYAEDDTLPDFSNDLDYNGEVHLLVDKIVVEMSENCTEVKDTWYLYEDSLIEAYKDYSLCDEDPRENKGLVAIYDFIMRAIAEYYEAEKEELLQQYMLSKKSNKQPRAKHVVNIVLDPVPNTEEATNE